MTNSHTPTVHVQFNMKYTFFPKSKTKVMYFLCKLGFVGLGHCSSYNFCTKGWVGVAREVSEAFSDNSTSAAYNAWSNTRKKKEKKCTFRNIFYFPINSYFLFLPVNCVPKLAAIFPVRLHRPTS